MPQYLESSLRQAMVHTVKARYLDRARGNNSPNAPTFSEQLFASIVMAVAHENGIYHRNGEQSRLRYNELYRYARHEVKAAIGRLLQNERVNQAKARLAALREELAAKPDICARA